MVRADPLRVRSVLTREQRRAVSSRAHALEIRAGAGTGKTTTLAHRLAALARGGTPEHRLLAVTFTRDAATGLARKLGALLGPRQAVRVSSFHAWAARELAGEAPRFLGQEEARRIVLREMRRAGGAPLAGPLGAGPGEDVADRALAFLSYVKNAQTTVGDAIDRQFPALAAARNAMERIAAGYEEGKGGRMDFDDLLLAFRDRLASSVAFRSEVAGRIGHLAVDEYQDVNRAQAEIVRLLAAGPGGVPVTVVGDPRQSIYGFRGASPDAFDSFLAPFGARGERVALTTSFRSTRAIVAEANALLPGPHALRARARAPLGPRVRQEGHEDAAGEARAALDHVAALLAKGAAPGDVVVLVRSRALAARYADEARGREGVEEVRVATIHAAKGLEWDHVVVLGAREGGLPSSQALRAPPAALPALLAEEQRLLYVAVTRARRSLALFWSGARSRFLPPEGRAAAGIRGGRIVVEKKEPRALAAPRVRRSAQIRI